MTTHPDIAYFRHKVRVLNTRISPSIVSTIKMNPSMMSSKRAQWMKINQVVEEKGTRGYGGNLKTVRK